jgi:hypothetical protein
VKNFGQETRRRRSRNTKHTNDIHSAALGEEFVQFGIRNGEAQVTNEEFGKVRGSGGRLSGHDAKRKREGLNKVEQRGEEKKKERILFSGTEDGGVLCVEPREREGTA